MSDQIEEISEGQSEPTKERAISFRVSEEEWKRIEEIAGTKGEKPNEWSRKHVVSESGKDRAMTWTERLIYEEIGRMSYLIGHGFGLLATGQLTDEKWKQVVKESKAQASATARKLLDQRLWKRELGQQMRKEEHERT
jgi:hypothetical protein